MSTGRKKTDNYGGAREGAGRKPETLSVLQVRSMLDRAKDYAETHGKALDEVLLDFIYSTESKAADKLAAIKVFKTYTMAKLNEGGETDQQLGPVFFPPDQRPDTSALYAIDGGKI